MPSIFRSFAHPARPFTVNRDGFSLNASVSCQAHQRDRLERLCRYVTRPPLALDRLSSKANGRVIYALKRPFSAWIWRSHLPNGIFTADNPRHDVVRRTMEPLFRQAIEGVADAAKLIAQPLLTSFSDKRRFELINDYALLLPSYALCHVLGVPEQDWPLLMQWISGILLAAG